MRPWPWTAQRFWQYRIDASGDRRVQRDLIFTTPDRLKHDYPTPAEPVNGQEYLRPSHPRQQGAQNFDRLGLHPAQGLKEQLIGREGSGDIVPYDAHGDLHAIEVSKFSASQKALIFS